MTYDTIIGTAVQSAANRCGITAELRQIYVAWTACFQRFCEKQGLSHPDPSAIGDFLSFLQRRADTEDSDLDRAREAVLFFFEQVADLPSPVLSALQLQHRRHHEAPSPRPASPSPEPSGEALTRVMRLMDSQRFDTATL